VLWHLHAPAKVDHQIKTAHVVRHERYLTKQSALCSERYSNRDT
jgi:hypothetical protein